MSSIAGRDPLAALLSDFPRRHVLVVGDAILDEYLYGNSSRISPEAPVPVVRVTHSRTVLGGAANAASNIVSLGGKATLISLVGKDDGGETLRRCAVDAGVTLIGIDHGAATLRKIRVVGQQQQMLRLDYEDSPPQSTAAGADIIRAFEAQVDSADIVVISDYAKGVLTPAVAAAIIERARRSKRLVIVDPRPQNGDCYPGCHYITPNWNEARSLLRLPDADPTPESARDVAGALVAKLNANVVLTLGPHGIVFHGADGEQFALPTLDREVFDVSGAGDTVVAAFALARASNADHLMAVELANRAASVVVAKFGTATVTPYEILQGTRAARLVTRPELATLAASLRASGKRIATINGSFDLLHAGHLHILNEARRQGDVLIVGLNSDASVRSYKGPNRPIVSEQGRAEMLLALRMVDYVHVFDEPDPIAFLNDVRPHVHVNGAEYGEECIERETVVSGGGRIHLVDRVPSLSTTRLLEALHTRS